MKVKKMGNKKHFLLNQMKDKTNKKKSQFYSFISSEYSTNVEEKQ